MGDFWIVQPDKRLVLYLPDTFSRQVEILSDIAEALNPVVAVSDSSEDDLLLPLI